MNNMDAQEAALGLLSMGSMQPSSSSASSSSEPQGGGGGGGGGYAVQRATTSAGNNNNSHHQQHQHHPLSHSHPHSLSHPHPHSMIPHSHSPAPIVNNQYQHPAHYVHHRPLSPPSSSSSPHPRPLSSHSHTGYNTPNSHALTSSATLNSILGPPSESPLIPLKRKIVLLDEGYETGRGVRRDGGPGEMREREVHGFGVGYGRVASAGASGSGSGSGNREREREREEEMGGTMRISTPVGRMSSEKQVSFPPAFSPYPPTSSTTKLRHDDPSIMPPPTPLSPPRPTSSSSMGMPITTPPTKKSKPLPPPDPPPAQAISSSMSTSSLSSHLAVPSAPAPVPPPETSSNDGIDCICGINFDDGYSVACDICGHWCHMACFNFPPGQSATNDIEFRCWRCEPRSEKERERAVRVMSAKVGAVAPVGGVVPAGGSGGVVVGDVGDEGMRRARRGSPAGSVVGEGGGGGRKGRKTSSAPTAAGDVVVGKRKRRPSVNAPAVNGVVVAPPITASTSANGVSSSATPATTTTTATAVEEEHVDIDEPWNQAYVHIKEDIVVDDETRQKLRLHAKNWRGVTALVEEPPLPSSSSSEPVLNPTTKLKPIPQNVISAHPLLSPHFTSTHPSILPPSYALHTSQPMSSNSLIIPLKSQITPASSYLRDPLNSYAHLGMPRPFVHLVGAPLEVSLDGRLVGNEGRWVRSGCFPNAVLRPVLCKEGRRRRGRVERVEVEGEEGGDGKRGKGKGKDGVDGKVKGGKGKERQKLGDEEEEDDTTLGFALFATRDLKANEEVVLGWEWDDRNVVHTLPALLETPGMFSSPTSTSISSPNQLVQLRDQMANILHALSSTFATCACGAGSRDCVIKRMRDFVQASAGLGCSSTPGSSSSYHGTSTTTKEATSWAEALALSLGVGARVDLGPLVGRDKRRGFSARERVRGSGGMGGMELISVEEGERVLPPRVLKGHLEGNEKGKGKERTVVVNVDADVDEDLRPFTTGPVPFDPASQRSPSVKQEERIHPRMRKKWMKGVVEKRREEERGGEGMSENEIAMRAMPPPPMPASMDPTTVSSAEEARKAGTGAMSSISASIPLPPEPPVTSEPTLLSSEPDIATVAKDDDDMVVDEERGDEAGDVVMRDQQSTTTSEPVVDESSSATINAAIHQATTPQESSAEPAINAHQSSQWTQMRDKPLSRSQSPQDMQSGRRRRMGSVGPPPDSAGPPPSSGDSVGPPPSSAESVGPPPLSSASAASTVDSVGPPPTSAGSDDSSATSSATATIPHITTSSSIHPTTTDIPTSFTHPSTTTPEDDDGDETEDEGVSHDQEGSVIVRKDSDDEQGMKMDVGVDDAARDSSPALSEPPSSSPSTTENSPLPQVTVLPPEKSLPTTSTRNIINGKTSIARSPFKLTPSQRPTHSSPTPKSPTTTTSALSKLVIGTSPSQQPSRLLSPMNKSSRPVSPSAQSPSHGLSSTRHLSPQNTNTSTDAPSSQSNKPSTKLSRIQTDVQHTPQNQDTPDSPLSPAWSPDEPEEGEVAMEVEVEDEEKRGVGEKEANDEQGGPTITTQESDLDKPSKPFHDFSENQPSDHATPTQTPSTLTPLQTHDTLTALQTQENLTPGQSHSMLTPTQTSSSLAPPEPTAAPKVKMSLKEFTLRKRKQREEAQMQGKSGSGGGSGMLLTPGGGASAPMTPLGSVSANLTPLGGPSATLTPVGESSAILTPVGGPSATLTPVAGPSATLTPTAGPGEALAPAVGQAAMLGSDGRQSGLGLGLGSPMAATSAIVEAEDNYHENGMEVEMEEKENEKRKDDSDSARKEKEDKVDEGDVSMNVDEVKEGLSPLLSMKEMKETPNHVPALPKDVKKLLDSPAPTTLSPLIGVGSLNMHLTNGHAHSSTPVHSLSPVPPSTLGLGLGLGVPSSLSLAPSPLVNSSEITTKEAKKELVESSLSSLNPASRRATASPAILGDEHRFTRKPQPPSSPAAYTSHSASASATSSTAPAHPSSSLSQKLSTPPPPSLPPSKSNIHAPAPSAPSPLGLAPASPIHPDARNWQASPPPPSSSFSSPTITRSPSGPRAGYRYLPAATTPTSSYTSSHARRQSQEDGEIGEHESEVVDHSRRLSGPPHPSATTPAPFGTATLNPLGPKRSGPVPFPFRSNFSFANNSSNHTPSHSPPTHPRSFGALKSTLPSRPGAFNNSMANGGRPNGIDTDTSTPKGPSSGPSSLPSTSSVPAASKPTTPTTPMMPSNFGQNPPTAPRALRQSIAKGQRPPGYHHPYGSFGGSPALANESTGNATATAGVVGGIGNGNDHFIPRGPASQMRDRREKEGDRERDGEKERERIERERICREGNGGAATRWEGQPRDREGAVGGRERGERDGDRERERERERDPHHHHPNPTPGMGRFRGGHPPGARGRYPHGQGGGWR